MLGRHSKSCIRTGNLARRTEACPSQGNSRPGEASRLEPTPATPRVCPERLYALDEGRLQNDAAIQHPHRLGQAGTKGFGELRTVDQLPVSMHTTYMAVTYEWTAGEEDWARLIRNFFGGHEGDLNRAFRRLIDLGRQLIDSPELPEALRSCLTQAVRMLDRGIVLESALI